MHDFIACVFFGDNAFLQMVWYTNIDKHKEEYQ